MRINVKCRDLTLLVVLMLWGCVTTNRQVQCLFIRDVPQEEKAFLIESPGVVIQAIDWFSVPPAIEYIELKEGRHVIKAMFGGKGVSGKSLFVEFIARPGRWYQAQAQVGKYSEKWELSVRDVTEQVRSGKYDVQAQVIPYVR